MAEIIPWDEIKQEYAKLFKNEIGNVAKPARMALGALIIIEKCGYSDIETVEQIEENPYLQYFLYRSTWLFSIKQYRFRILIKATPYHHETHLFKSP